MIIHISNQQTALKILSSSVKKIVREVIRHEGTSCDEVSVYFVDTPHICELHDQFFQDPAPTDCISLPIDEEDGLGYRVLGDIFVCPQTAIEYANTHDTDPYEETTLYVVHGLLHLMGYDDQEEKDIAEIRAAETRHMNHLKEKRLILCQTVNKRSKE